MGLLEDMLAQSGVTPPTVGSIGGGGGLLSAAGSDIPPRLEEPQPSQPAAPIQPTQQPKKFGDVVSDFAGNFLFSLGQAFKAQASHPGARGTMAGIGAALEGPMLYKQAQIQQEREKQQMENDRRQLAMRQKELENSDLRLQLERNQQILAQMKEQREAKAAEEEAKRKANAPIPVPANTSLARPNAEGKFETVYTAPGPEKQPNRSNFSRDTALYKGKPQDILIDTDPDSKTAGHQFLPTAEGLKDITGETSHYEKPAAQIQLQQSAEATVPSWVGKIATGEADLGDIPQSIRSQVVAALDKGDVRILPKNIREGLKSLQSARELLKPIKELVSKINSTSDAAEKAKMSVQLESYTQSVGTILARSVGQERGVATDKDVARAVGLVPGWKSANFAPDFAKSQLSLLEGVIDAQERSYNTYFQKQSTSGTAPTTTASPEGWKIINVK